MSTQQLLSLCPNSEPSHFLTPLLHQCFQTKNLRSTKILHAHLLVTGLFSTSLNLNTNLILSYAPHIHNNLQTLTNLLNSIKPTNHFPFSSLVSIFPRHGFPFYSLWTTSFMQKNNILIDNYTLCSSITASTSIKAGDFGKQLHTHVVKLGWSSSVYVGSSLVNFYAKLSAICDASKMFDEIPLKNIVCVNALLLGIADAKMWDEGLSLVQKLPIFGLEYDQFTLSALLRLCAGLSAIELGRQVHGNLIRKIVDIENDVFLQSSLIEMYGKCGFVEKARNVFDLMGIEKVRERKRDVVLWTSMIGTYGRNGQFNEVIQLYELMIMQGVRPDGVVFISVISACGHTGNVSLGLKYFESMVHDFGLQPGPEHYSCVVDLLCRAGEMEKAWKLVSENCNSYNSKGSVSMWGALLSACTDHRNVEMGRLAAERALELEPGNVGICVLLSNLYANVGMWNEIEGLRQLMKERGLKKDVGCSWLD